MPTRRQLLLAGFATFLHGATTGCGTILHPERRGQPAGRFDWSIVALDTIALIFFFIPGVIAFAVDFTTGAIYLPSGPPPDVYTPAPVPRNGVPSPAPAPNEPLMIPPAARKSGPARRLISLLTPRKRPNREAIEEALARHTGRTIRLDTPDCYSESLARIDDFWTAYDRRSGWS